MVCGILIALVVASSGFVPVGVLPGWLHGVFTDQPVTQFVDAVRSLAMNGTVHASGAAWTALSWGAGLVLVVGALAVRRDRRVA